MNIIACDSCAVLLDADKLPFPTDIWTPDGTEIDTTKADYNQRTKSWDAYCKCPVCDWKIFRSEA